MDTKPQQDTERPFDLGQKRPKGADSKHMTYIGRRILTTIGMGTGAFIAFTHGMALLPGLAAVGTGMLIGHAFGATAADPGLLRPFNFIKNKVVEYAGKAWDTALSVIHKVGKPVVAAGVGALGYAAAAGGMLASMPILAAMAPLSFGIAVGVLSYTVLSAECNPGVKDGARWGARLGLAAGIATGVCVMAGMAHFGLFQTLFTNLPSAAMEQAIQALPLKDMAFSAFKSGAVVAAAATAVGAVTGGAIHRLAAFGDEVVHAVRHPRQTLRTLPQQAINKLLPAPEQVSDTRSAAPVEHQHPPAPQPSHPADNAPNHVANLLNQRQQDGHDHVRSL